MIYELMNQAPTETFSIIEQQLMFDIILNAENAAVLDVKAMKHHVKEVSSKATDDSQFDSVRDMLKQMSTLEMKGAPAEQKPAAPAGDAGGDQPGPGQQTDEEKIAQDEKDVKKLTDDKKEDEKEDSKADEKLAAELLAKAKEKQSENKEAGADPEKEPAKEEAKT
jgi:hypothetical protein